MMSAACVNPGCHTREKRVSSTPRPLDGISAPLEYLYGEWSRGIVVSSFHILVRRRPTSPRPDPKTTGRLGGATVKGGRRPSRSDAALDGREPGGRLEGRARFWR